MATSDIVCDHAHTWRVRELTCARTPQAPLEFTNPLRGGGGEGGHAIFTPRKHDFVLFPSFLSHTVPMRHAPRDGAPRVSVAFNLWLAGDGMDRRAAPGRSACTSVLHRRAWGCVHAEIEEP